MYAATAHRSLPQRPAIRLRDDRRYASGLQEPGGRLVRWVALLGAVSLWLLVVCTTDRAVSEYVRIATVAVLIAVRPHAPSWASRYL